MTSSFFSSLLRGQLISVLIAGTGIFATLLSDTPKTHRQLNFPTFMSLLNYILLTSYLARNNFKSGSKCFNGYKSLIFQCISRCGSSSSSSGSSSNATMVDNVEGSDFDDGNKSSTGNSSSIDRSINSDKKNHKIQYMNTYYWYIIFAIVDVEANFLIIQAYNYTSITSIMLLDCFTIPCVMVLSYLFLGCKYSNRHVLGIILCLSGLICIVYSDSTHTDSNSSSSSNKNIIYGDILCLSGAALYGVSNVMQETLVKFYDRNDFLGILGGFGSAFALIQFCILESASFSHAAFSIDSVFYLIGFVLCIFCMYTNTSVFLQNSDSILFNLSLLTSDCYAVLFSYFFYGKLVTWLYFLALALVAVGLTFYHSEVEPMKLGENHDSIISIRKNISGSSSSGSVIVDCNGDSSSTSDVGNSPYESGVTIADIESSSNNSSSSIYSPLTQNEL